jgi:hypothetical protein
MYRCFTLAFVFLFGLSIGCGGPAAPNSPPPQTTNRRDGVGSGDTGNSQANAGNPGPNAAGNSSTAKQGARGSQGQSSPSSASGSGTGPR